MKNKLMRKALLNKGNFGAFSKPLANMIGLEAAVLLDFLVYKYDHFVIEKKIFKIIYKQKSFYLTYRDIEYGTSIKQAKLARKTKSNPLQILENHDLIKRTTIQIGFRRTTYYSLFFKRIENAYKKAQSLQSKRLLEYEKNENKKIELALKKKNKLIDSFLEANVNSIKKHKKNSTKKEASSETVDSTSSNVQNSHITNNKSKEKKVKKRNKLTPKEIVPKNFEDWTDDEFEQLFSTLPESIDEPDSINMSFLFYLVFKTRTQKISHEDFYCAIIQKLPEDRIKGWKMSVKDEILIYDCIINNPMFELEDEDIQDRNDKVDWLLTLEEDISIEELNEEVDFDEYRYEHLYTHICEKILFNYKRMIDGRLKFRFGNFFVGINEFSENYVPFMERYD